MSGAYVGGLFSWGAFVLGGFYPRGANVRGASVGGLLSGGLMSRGLMTGYAQIYSPENMSIGDTARYLDVSLNQPKFTHYRLVIRKVDSIASYLVYFQLYSLDEVIERSISDSPESYLEV